MNHPVQCRCGSLKGYVSHPKNVNRCVCYCRDCQAFAHFLGRPAEILDAQGGTDVVQTSPANVTFTQGQDALACMRLTEKGMLRWYTTCCNTPVGNTMADFRVSFVGLVHTCLEGGGSLDDSFGPVRARVNKRGAKGSVPPSSSALMFVILRLIAMVAGARITGSYKRTPFFSADTGTPIATAKILSWSERKALMSALSLAS